MTRPLALLALGLAAALPAMAPALAQADTLLDRYRDASIARAGLLEDFLITRVPEFEGRIPELGWDDEIAVMSQCILDGIAAAQGAGAAEEYVAAMEDWSLVPITSFEAMVDSAPSVLDDMAMMDLTIGCGAMEVSFARMQESGMLALLQDPSVMARLTAP